MGFIKYEVEIIKIFFENILRMNKLMNISAREKYSQKLKDVFIGK